MTDELDALKAALQSRLPAADPATKAAHLRLAMQNFDAGQRYAQELAPDPRPMADRPARAGFLPGVRRMLTTLTARGTLAATTSIAALCLGIILVLPEFKTPPLIPGATQSEDATLEAVQPAPPAPAPKAAQQATPKSADERRADDAETPIDQAAVSGGAAAGLAATSTSTSTTIAATDAAPVAPLDGLSDTRSDGLANSMEAAPVEREIAATEAPRVKSTAGIVADATAPAQMQETVTLPEPEPDTEAFANAETNPLKITAESPVSTFSIDVDTASYAVVRSSLMAGMLPPPDAVRIEEMVNYFPYEYPAPDASGAPFRASVTVLPTPWNAGTKLVHIGIQGRLPPMEDRPPLNLVFLIDTSGSMEDANRLPLLKQSFRLMTGQLRPEDRVAIVTYAGSAGQVLAPTPAADSAAIFAALDNLAAGGSTAGQQGLQQAYAVAETMADPGEVTRVILATDGDFNVGLSDPEALETFIADKRKSGTYLSVLGFGRGNLDDATMQALAQAGNGQAAYIDTLAEAQKVLVDQLTGALFPIADDVKIQVEFNPATVAEYRLIGYETRALNREDFNNDRVDAGEIGAGHTVTAIYEVTPVGSPAQLSDPLRYRAADATTPPADAELGFLKLRYKAPGAATSVLIETPIARGSAEPGADIRFAVAIAGFGQLLTASPYLGDWNYDDAMGLATAAKGTDAYGYRAEAVTLMRLAKSLAAN